MLEPTLRLCRRVSLVGHRERNRNHKVWSVLLNDLPHCHFQNYLGSSSLLVKMSRKEQKRSELHFVPPILLAGDLLKLVTSATN